MAVPVELPAQEIEIAIDSRLENVALLGSAVSGIAALLGWNESERFNLELCAVEAATNCVRHAYGGEAGHPVRLRIRVDGGRLEMRVADRGRPVPEEQRAPPAPAFDPDDPATYAEGGRGLFLLRALMDEVAFLREDGWNVVLLARRQSAP